MRTQLELTFKIGFQSNHNQYDFARKITEVASTVCGGCEIIWSEGYWKSCGATHAETFTGALIEERTLTLKLSCEVEKCDRAYLEVKNAITYYAGKYQIDTDWVHVQRTPFTGMHFSVTQNKLSASEIRDVVSPGTRGSH